MDIEKILAEMTLKEKARILAGCGMTTYAVDRLGIPAIRMADGPHGVRCEREKNMTSFPNLCLLAATFSHESAYLMGSAIADDCVKEGVSLILGPGVNIKRHILCGRNFEYFSEDPVIAGELAAEYVKGVEDGGVSTCVKHYAANNQEEYRTTASVEVDERVLREIYLRPFEIAVNKANPDSIMTSYNKINGVWASENPHLLDGILKSEWGYEGLAVSDWGAVHDRVRSINTGLDLQMPGNPAIEDDVERAVASGELSVEKVDEAVRRMLTFVYKNRRKDVEYDRDRQHNIARKVASDGIVLLKNEKKTLPITKEKYKKVAVVGEYAVKPLIAGQGSAEVLVLDEYIDSPLDQLREALPEVEFDYVEMYKSDSFSHEMLWPKSAEFKKRIADADLVLFFAGSMVSEDTENFDRLSARINQNVEMFIGNATQIGKPVAVVLSGGGALIFGDRLGKADAIVETFLAGEAMGGAVADILTGKVNPSGKLPETFPRVMRRDLEYPGTELLIEYKERFDVGYRYYDKHPDEINYPFGHGLSYTSFLYSEPEINKENMTLSFRIANTGDVGGAEAYQVYVSDPYSTVVRPVKELRKFGKVYLDAGEEKRITLTLDDRDFAYYNTSLGKWCVENGRYDIMIGSSSRDIRLSVSIMIDGKAPYSMSNFSEAMIG